MEKSAKNTIIELPEGIVRDDYQLLCTASGRVFLCTGPLKLLLGEDLTGRNLNDFIEDKIAASIIGAAQREDEFDFTCTILTKSFSCTSEGVGDYIAILLFPLNDTGTVFIDQNSASFISGEINSVLGVALPTMQTLKAELSNQPNKTGILIRSMYRLLRLSRNLSTSALAANGALVMHYTEEDAVEITKDIVAKLDPYMEFLGVKLECTTPETPIVCKLDRQKFERMLLNMISNAVKAVGKNGKVGIKVGIFLSHRENEVVLRVSDNGEGIDGNVLDSMFDKHKSVDPEKPWALGGVGFGLAIVKAYAENHGGRLVIMSDPSGGTTTCVTLPKNKQKETMSFGANELDYAAGMDRVLLEFSSVLPSSFYTL